MARSIPKNKTILDYVDVIKNYNTLTGAEIVAIALNKYEWLQLLQLVQVGYNGAHTSVSVSREGTSAKYSDMFLYYDGGDNMSDEYIESIMWMQEQLDNAVYRQQHPEEATLNEVPTTARGTPRRGRNAPRPDIPSQPAWNVAIPASAVATPFGQSVTLTRG